MSRVLDFDPITGIRTIFDWVDGKMVIGYEQDTEQIIEANTLAIGDLEAHKRAAKNEWAHYARVPYIVIMDWKQRLGVDFFNRDHGKRVMQLLADPEYSKLKVTTYRHDR